MIFYQNPNFTLILGAGASEPYRFPLNSGLRDLIVGTEVDFAGLFEKERCQEFRVCFRDSTLPTIDEFLDERSDFSSVGKASIGHHIGDAENRDIIIPEKSSEANWYPTFFNHYFRNKRDILSPERKLNILTFNYDRSLEHYLARSISNRANVSES